MLLLNQYGECRRDKHSYTDRWRWALCLCVNICLSEECGMLHLKSLSGKEAMLAVRRFCIIINRISLKCKENILETVERA